MLAIEIREPGDPDVLVPVERPRPEPAAGEVLIKVAAAGVNRPDIMQRRGQYPPPPGASDIPGLEVAGAIEEVGDGAGACRPGDRVCALVAGGGYAEYCTAPAPQCLPVPQRLDLTAAAAIPETFFTVWTNVFERGRLLPGESLLVHGGASGIGTTAIQLARALGSRVFATAGSSEKCAACERLGAESAINYRQADFVAVVREATHGRGVDVILDMVGGDYLTRNIEALAMEGRLVQIATLGGAKVQVDLRVLMLRRLTLTGSTLRTRSVAEKGAIARTLRERVWPLLDAGTVAPVIHATFPLRAAPDAHRLMEADTHIGKIVLVVKKTIDRTMNPITSLQVTDTKAGTGAHAVAGKEVSVHYTGWLYDVGAADHHGRKFDSSRDHGEPFTFALGAGMVICGWDQGVAGMKVGGSRTLVIPPALGYGARGAGAAIPPNSTLVFDVELLGVR